MVPAWLAVALLAAEPVAEPPAWDPGALAPSAVPLGRGEATFQLSAGPAIGDGATSGAGTFAAAVGLSHRLALRVASSGQIGPGLSVANTVTLRGNVLQTPAARLAIYAGFGTHHRTTALDAPLRPLAVGLGLGVALEAGSPHVRVDVTAPLIGAGTIDADGFRESPLLTPRGMAALIDGGLTVHLGDHALRLEKRQDGVYLGYAFSRPTWRVAGAVGAEMLAGQPAGSAWLLVGWRVAPVSPAP